MQRRAIHQGSATGPLSAAFIYDLNGNLTQKCEGGTVSRSATTCTGSTTLNLNYDALDRLTHADKTGLAGQSYLYDPLGRRIKKTVGSTTTDYLYDGARIYAEYPGSWNQAAAVYTHGAGIDTPLIRTTATAEQRYYHQDGLGSVVAVTDAAGTTQGTQRFDAWGKQLASTGTIPQYSYTGVSGSVKM